MSLSQILREKRIACGVSQEQLAKALHVSSSAVSNYERGARDMPEDLLDRAINTLNSPRMRILKCTECRAGMFSGLPLLDLTDTHPVVTRDKLVEELEEAAASVGSLQLINKTGPNKLSEDDKEQIREALEQVLDCIPGIALYISSLTVHYNIDIDVAREQAKKKYFDRGYWSAKKMPAAATAGHR